MFSIRSKILAASSLAAITLFAGTGCSLFSTRASTPETSSVAVAEATPKPAAKMSKPAAEPEFIDTFDGTKINRTAAEWKKTLSPTEFYVLREEGTERPYTGEYTDNHADGTYHCAACGLAVFSSSAKFESGTGWPSFFQPIAKENVSEVVDKRIGEARTEIECARCGSHLGHVFDDGPEPTGLRYCINSVSLKFRKRS